MDTYRYISKYLMDVILVLLNQLIFRRLIILDKLRANLDE